MPFTPFHMGPGLALKSIAGRRMSLMIFGFSQVAMDIEPLVRILRNDSILHGFTHTYVGATLIAVPSVLLGRPVCQFLLDRWRPDPADRFLTWLRGPQSISWGAAIAGAFIGTYSHVVLDSIMHSDMHPLAPFSQANALLGTISLSALHIGCVLSGLFGGLVILMKYAARRSAPPS